MAYTTARTWVTSEVVTASLMNTHVRDNIDFLYDRPACRVYKATDFSHTSSGSFVAITFDTERYDTDTMHSTATNTDRITFTTAGLYTVGGSVAFAADVDGIRGIRVRLNGTTELCSQLVINSGASTVELTVETTYKFAAADYVQLVAFQTSGGTLALTATGNMAPEFWATWSGSGSA